MNPQTLEISGAHGSVPNTLLESERSSNRLGILFPGRAYTNAMPVMHYPRLALEAWDADVLQVNYNYTTPQFMHAKDAEQHGWIAADAKATLNAVLEHKAYTEVVLVGKSLGTIALAALLDDPRLQHAKFVWLTPLIQLEAVTNRILEHPRRALFAIGSEDPVFNLETLEHLRKATNGELLVIPDANHSIEVDGNVIATVRAQLEIMTKFERFLRN